MAGLKMLILDLKNVQGELNEDHIKPLMRQNSQDVLDKRSKLEDAYQLVERAIAILQNVERSADFTKVKWNELDGGQVQRSHSVDSRDSET